MVKPLDYQPQARGNLYRNCCTYACVKNQLQQVPHMNTAFSRFNKNGDGVLLVRSKSRIGMTLAQRRSQQSKNCEAFL
jgi:hypothetical protein